MAIIKKRYSNAKFQKLLSLLHHPKKAKELESCFLPKGGNYYLVEKPDKGQKKILAECKKIIKKNKGVLRTGMLALVALPVIALVVFVLFFLNPLAERGLESALESVFEAQTDVRGVRIQPFKPAISIAEITQADPDREFYNLFSVFNLNFELNLNGLLAGSLVIEQAGMTNLLWGTQRTESGALTELPGDSPSAENGSESKEGRGLLDGVGESLDAGELFESARSQFETEAKIVAFEDRLAVLTDEWSGKTSSLNAEFENLDEEYGHLLSVNPSNLDNPAELLELASELNAASSAASKVTSGISEEISVIKAEYAAVQAEYADLRRSLDADIAMLGAELDGVSGGSPDGLVDGFLKELLTQLLGSKMTLVNKVLGAYSKVGNVVDGRSPPAGGRPGYPGFRPGGVDVDFGAENFPPFLLKEFNASFEAADAQVDMVITNLALPAAYQDGDAEFEYSSQGDLGVAVGGRLSPNGETGTHLLIEGSAAPVPFVLQDLPEFLGLTRFSGDAVVNFTVDGNAGDALNISTAARIMNVSSQAQGAAGEAISDALVDANSLNVTYRATVAPAGQIRNSEVESNISGIISGYARRRVQQEIDAVRQDLERYGEQYVGENLSRLSSSFGPLENVFSDATGVQADVLNYEDGFSDLGNQARSRAEHLGQSAVEDAASKARDAASDKLPSLPGF